MLKIEFLDGGVGGGQSQSTSNMFSGDSNNPMGMLAFVSFIRSAQSTIARYQQLDELAKDTLRVLDEEPTSTTVPRDYSAKYVTTDTTSAAATTTDGVSYDGSGANGANLAQVVRRVAYREARLGTTLGKFVRAQLNINLSELEHIKLQLDEKWWRLLGVDLSQNGLLMLIALKDGVGSILGGSAAAPATSY
jgi:hypothetical protein